MNAPTKNPVTMYEAVSETAPVCTCRLPSCSSTISGSRIGESKLIWLFGGMSKTARVRGRSSNVDSPGVVGGDDDREEDVRDKVDGKESRDHAGEGGNGVISGSIESLDAEASVDEDEEDEVDLDTDAVEGKETIT